jgi:hypothetical protein
VRLGNDGELVRDDDRADQQGEQEQEGGQQPAGDTSPVGLSPAVL